MSTEDASRMFLPQRKVVTRNASSSSLASNSSTSSTSTVTSANDTAHIVNGDVPAPAKKKQRGGFWPVSKAESTSSVTHARVNGAVQPAASNGVHVQGQKNGLQPAMPDHLNGAVNGTAPRNQSPALLVLLPMNGTFERKQINVPIHPDPPQKIGRQTNAKTLPKPDNGYFDSKVLSRQHAEIYADASGRIWIKDVKSSNGTFVNGERLSPENRESEPKELKQSDSLELGIDIVSEDQKTIVHHKVSAKVEFAGFPGKAGNALDLLSFGELDPSQGNQLLNSPMSAPMVHSRSQQGRPLGGRASVASSTAGGPGNTAAQRQANYWGTPLNIEQLVKQVGVEMRAARQQAQDLDHAKSFLNSLLPADGGPVKMPSGSSKDGGLQSKQANARAKAPRIDHSARFADPPAPPPQQPLPEKPDGAKSSIPPILTGMLKRDTTAKPVVNGTTVSPTAQNSQIISLLQDLQEAKKQIESQGSKVKELEDMLRQERQARQAAEDKVKRMEESTISKPVMKVEEEPSTVEEPKQESIPESAVENSNETRLQLQIDQMLSEMQLIKTNLEQTTQRAEVAETEKTSLAAMIEKYRQEREEQKSSSRSSHETDDDIEEIERPEFDLNNSNATIKDGRQSNGYVRGPKLPADLQHVVATALQHQQINGEVPAQYAPYVSMMGVVLIGVGIMAYLNSWQKVDK